MRTLFHNGTWVNYKCKCLSEILTVSKLQISLSTVYTNMIIDTIQYIYASDTCINLNKTNYDVVT